MVVEWNHQKAAGNSGVFICTTPASIERLENPNNLGPPSSSAIFPFANCHRQLLGNQAIMDSPIQR